MNIIKALKKRNTIVKLNKINIVRCCHTSTVILFLTLFLMFTDVVVLQDKIFIQKYGWYTLCGCVVSVILMLSIVILFQVHYSRLASRIITDLYIASMEIILLSMAYEALKENSNAIFYVCAVLFITAVPTFCGMELYVAAGSQLLVMLLFLALFKEEDITVLTILTCNVISVVLSYRKYVAVFQHLQISERLYSEMKASDQDPLTGLLNRRGMDKKIKALYPLCKRNKIPVGVIMLDIDEFKKYNDTFGHPEGDSCIKRVSEILKATARRNTDIIARVGGEEFLIFVQDVRREELISLATRLQRSVEEMRIKHAPTASNRCVTISIGLAHTDLEEGMTFEQLYETADQELYLAKRSGRNCVGMNHAIVYWNEATQNRVNMKKVVMP